MKKFAQGLNPEKVERYVETLESFIEQDAYLDEYISHIDICKKEFNLFIATGDIRILNDKEKPCLMELLNVLEIKVSPDSEINRLKCLLLNERHHLDTFISQLKHIKLIIRKRELKRVREELKNKRDDRIIINLPTAVFDEIIDELCMKNYIAPLTRSERDCHFRCSDGPAEYDILTSRTHRIKWKRSDTSFTVFLKETARSGIINANSKRMNYKPFADHFLNRRGEEFTKLPKKYYNIKNCSIHKEIISIIKKQRT